MTRDDLAVITRYKLAVARALNAECEVNEAWATMTQSQRRLALSARVELPIK